MSSGDSGSETESVVASVASGISKASSTSTSSTTYLTGYTPVPWYRFSFRTIVLTLLPLFSFFGAYGTWSLASRNGTFETLVTLLSENNSKFPGTEELLIMKYTGIKALDHQLGILVAFFAPVVDFKNPALNLLAIWGLGQFGAVWTVMMMESMRLGNKGRAVSFVGLVGLIFQNISYTVTTPLWLFVHLITSPVAKPFPGTHANSVLLISTLDLRILPLSITISYLLPTILMALPSPEHTTPETHQRLLALWQAFPLLTVLTHRILRSITTRISTYFFPTDPHARPPAPQGASYLANAKNIYRLTLGLCIITHLPVLLLTLIPTTILPSSSPLASPNSLFTLASETPSSVFLPYLPLPSTRVDFASGVRTFLQWDIYIGSVAFVLWAMLLYRNATTEKAIVDPNTSLPIYRELLVGERRDGRVGWRGLVWKVLGWGVVGGPIGAVVVLLWERDEIVRLKIKQGI